MRSDRYVRPKEDYVRYARAELRFITRSGERILQQLYEDGYGKQHWVDVPTWTLAELADERTVHPGDGDRRDSDDRL